MSFSFSSSLLSLATFSFYHYFLLSVPYSFILIGKVKCIFLLMSKLHSESLQTGYIHVNIKVLWVLVEPCSTVIFFFNIINEINIIVARLNLLSSRMLVDSFEAVVQTVFKVHSRALSLPLGRISLNFLRDVHSLHSE